MRVSIIGTGYVGLVTGACLADKGHNITCVDVNAERVALLNRAGVPFHEAGLEALVKRNVGRRLSATTALQEAVLGTDLTLIAVGTPFVNGQIDVAAVLSAAREIGVALRSKDSYHVVVVKSTVVPGTTDELVLPELERASGRKAGADFGVAMNPEFLSEGEAVGDCLRPDRIVIGAIDQRSAAALDQLYAPFDASVPRVRTSTRTAEMIKYASNALLATLISFSNEIANLSAALGNIDAVDVFTGVHLSQYFQCKADGALPSITSFLMPGCGFGGSCLPKDVSALIAQGNSTGSPMPLLEAVMQTNSAQPAQLVSLLARHWRDLAGIRTAVLGLSFKPGTSDVRESPAFPIIRELLERGALVKAYDPVANDEAAAKFGEHIEYCGSLADALQNIDAAIVVTPWPEFRELPRHLAGRDVVLVDGRRAFDPASVAKYEGIGR